MENSDEKKVEKPPYPKSVFFIIGNEFCERFSYYGMKAVLILYLKDILLYSDDTSTVIYHVFSMACYFTPIFGAMIADSLLGKFRTIFYISIVYAAGNTILSVAAIPNSLSVMIPVSMIGLTLIAVGTGGIKPCVSAFGGDQFKPGQEKELESFFSLFYMSINVGSVLSTFITPYLREDVPCFNTDSCFPLAFGVPAILMVVSLILFLIGRPLYKINPPSGNIVIKVLKCIGHALRRKSGNSGSKRDHWLDYADDRYDAKLISDVKAVLKVLFLYLPLPVFWALFDQQGSRWTLQATRMNGVLSHNFRLKPDQMQVINPLLIIAFIPLFQYGVYPALAKCHIVLRPLQRITIGGLLAASAFIIAGFVQLHLETRLPKAPANGFSRVSFINAGPCALNGSIFEDKNIIYKGMIFKDLKFSEVHNITFHFECESETKTSLSLNFTHNADAVVFFYDTEGKKIITYEVEDQFEKSKKGDSNVRIIFNFNYNFEENENATFILKGDKDYFFAPENSNISYSNNHIGNTNYSEIPPGKYELYLSYNETYYNETPLATNLEVKMGGNYIIMVVSDKNSSMTKVWKETIVPPNNVSMLLQIPQYVVITAGEIMFSITGLEFSYSQAPKSMKSVLQAAWLLTVAFGNLIVVIVAEAVHLNKQSYEFFMFAGLMVIDMIIFAIMAFFYVYTESVDNEDVPIEFNDFKKEGKQKELNGVTNYGYQTEDSRF